MTWQIPKYFSQPNQLISVFIEFCDAEASSRSFSKLIPKKPKTRPSNLVIYLFTASFRAQTVNKREFCNLLVINFKKPQFSHLPPRSLLFSPKIAEISSKFHFSCSLLICMGEPLVAEPTPTEQSPLSTNSVAFQSSATDLPVSTETFGVEEVLRAFAYFCDKNSLDKKQVRNFSSIFSFPPSDLVFSSIFLIFQVALGLFLSLLLIIFSVGTLIAWNRYSPIIQEFIIKENIEKARNKSNEKNS